MAIKKEKLDNELKNAEIEYNKLFDSINEKRKKYLETNAEDLQKDNNKKVRL